MILIFLGVELKFILHTLKEINLSMKKVDDVEFNETLEITIFNLDNLINQLEDLFEKELNQDILKNVKEEDLDVEPSYQQWVNIESFLLNLKKALMELADCKALHDLIIFNRLIKCHSLVEISLFKLKKKIDQDFS